MALVKTKSTSGGCLMSLLLFLPMIMWKAWVVSKLFGWFVQQYVPFTPALTEFMGLLIIVLLCRSYGPSIDEEKEKDVTAEKTFAIALGNAMVYGYFLIWGYIIKTCLTNQI